MIRSAFKPKPTAACRVCKGQFTKHRSTQKVCGRFCAVALARVEASNAARKAEKKIKAEKLESIKPKGKWIKETQENFNLFIRMRDHGKPCISCDRHDHEIDHDTRGGKWDCGHYLTVGSAPELRFEPLNAARQCKNCNRDKSGNQVRYRQRLIDRIGQERVDWLEGPHEAKKFTVDQLKRLKKYYARRARHYKKLRGVE